MSTFQKAFPFLNTNFFLLEISKNENDEISREDIEPILQLLVYELLKFDNIQIGKLLPELTYWNDTAMNETVFSIRASHVFGASNIVLWKDLSEYSIGSLKHFKNIGKKTISEILSKCILKSISRYIPPSTESNPLNPLSAQESKIEIEKNQLISEFLKRITLWAAYETDSNTIGNILESYHYINLPKDLYNEFSSILNIKIDRHKVLEKNSSIIDSIEKLFTEFKPIWRNILESRVLNLEPLTLSDIGFNLGVTRERVRQIQVKANDLLDILLNDSDYFLLKWRAHSLKEKLRRFAFVENSRTQKILSNIVRDIPKEKKKAASSLLLYIAGPYKLLNGWLILSDYQLPKLKDFSTLFDEFGIIPYEKLKKELFYSGIQNDYFLDWLKHFNLKHLDSSILITHQSVVDNCISLLSFYNKPKTIDELIKVLGKDAIRGTIQNGFSQDQRVIKINKNQWALKEWGFEEYFGIVDAIVNSINNHSGYVPINKLIEELKLQFNTPEHSVRTFVNAPELLYENGIVKRRVNIETFHIDKYIEKCSGVFYDRISKLYMQIIVDRDLLRGSGRSIPQAVAYTLGVTPGLNTFFSNQENKVTVGWSIKSATGPFLGSIKNIISDLNIKIDNRIRLEFDIELKTISAVPICITNNLTQEEQFLELTGLSIDGDIRSTLSKSLNVDQKNLYKILTSRKEHELLYLIESNMENSSLDKALESFVNIL